MLAEFESRILALIDEMVDHASDDELFASGYLRGHLTLAVAELEGGTITLRKQSTIGWCAARRKRSAQANCRRRTRFWCRECGITYISGQSNNPLTAWPEKAARRRDTGIILMSRCFCLQPTAVAAARLISPLFPSAVSAPIIDSDSTPPASLGPAARFVTHLRRQYFRRQWGGA